MYFKSLQADLAHAGAFLRTGSIWPAGWTKGAGLKWGAREGASPAICLARPDGSENLAEKATSSWVGIFSQIFFRNTQKTFKNTIFGHFFGPLFRKFSVQSTDSGVVPNANQPCTRRGLAGWRVAPKLLVCSWPVLFALLAQYAWVGGGPRGIN